MSLIILTKSPQYSLSDWVSSVKSFTKSVLGQQRGPDAVVDSLSKGLHEIGCNFLLNPKMDNIHPTDTVYINGSISALRWAIEARKNGEIKKLLVGPVMVVLPEEEQSIITSDYIDVIIVPAPWVRKLWIDRIPELSKKICIWSAGVSLSDDVEGIRDQLIIYKKNCDESLYREIKKFLKERHVEYHVIKYGRYSYTKYQEMLGRSYMMIYLSKSESQGLALCEAWEKDVPTFVWNRGYWDYKGNIWKDDAISAPYLTAQSGKFFTDIEEFKKTYDDFVNSLQSFSPRSYVESEFKNQTVAKRFLALTL